MTTSPVSVSDHNVANQQPCVSCGKVEWETRFHKQGFDFVSCRNCRLRRLEPMPTVEQLDEHYANRFASGNYKPEFASERLPTLQGIASTVLAAQPIGQRILDVGCFDGALLDLFKAKGWQTWGIELQGQAAEIAESNHPGCISNATVEDAASSLDVEVDVVTAVGLIEHLRDPLALFQLADRVLAKGGLFVIQTPDAKSIPARVLGKYWPCIAAPEHVTYFRRDNLVSMLQSRGYSIHSAKSHWKRLRVGYAYDQLQHFGPEIRKVLRVGEKVVPKKVWQLQAPMYGGEMLVIARKSK